MNIDLSTYKFIVAYSGNTIKFSITYPKTYKIKQKVEAIGFKRIRGN